jgi:hypothetical protein
MFNRRMSGNTLVLNIKILLPAVLVNPKDLAWKIRQNFIILVLNIEDSPNLVENSFDFFRSL